MSNVKTVIKVSHVSQSYGSYQVLNDISFEVYKGEILGLLGMNGAGKTTTLECLEGFLKYEGNISIDGQIAIQSQNESLPAYMKVSEAITLFSKWKKASLEPQLLKALDLLSIMNKQYQQLSTGQKRRLHLALTLIGQPDILILDEPTAGLDVAGRFALHQIIRQLQKKGVTIVIASHDMNEVESLCQRIGILKQGKMVFLGTLEDFTLYMGKCYRIKVITQEGENLYTTQDVRQTLSQILDSYQKQNLEILDMNVSRGTLEQHFISMAGGIEK